MLTFRRFFAGLAIAGFLLAPLSAYAITPMGGYVTLVRPCNVSYLITVINPGIIGSGEFMWTPGTINFLYGPPVLHSWVVGMSDVILPCFVGHVLIGYGQRITFMGASIPFKGVATDVNNPGVLSGHGLY